MGDIERPLLPSISVDLTLLGYSRAHLVLLFPLVQQRLRENPFQFLTLQSISLINGNKASHVLVLHAPEYEIQCSPASLSSLIMYYPIHTMPKVKHV